VRGTHRSEIPTDEYRAAFGCLDFSDQGDRAPLVTERRIVRSQGWRDHSPGVGELAYGLPDAILEAGTSLATGVIHTLSGANFWVWDEPRRPFHLQWPESSGGLDTLRRIFERHRESQQPVFGKGKKRSPPLTSTDGNPTRRQEITSVRSILSCTSCYCRSGTGSSEG
jgi:hypothetical protein